MGHGHPAVSLSEGVKKEKYKCFLVGKYSKAGNGKRDVIIVLSFFPLVEGTDPRDVANRSSQTFGSRGEPSGFDMGFAWKFNLNNFDVKFVGKGLEVLDFGRLSDIN